MKNCIDCTFARINPSTLEAYGAGDYYGHCINKLVENHNKYINLSEIIDCKFYQKSRILSIPGISYNYVFPDQKT